MTFKYSLADETEPATRRSSGRVFQAKETAGAKALGQDHVGRTVWKPVWLEQSRGGGEGTGQVMQGLLGCGKKRFILNTAGNC